MKTLRWMAAIVVSGFLLGALASAVTHLLDAGALSALTDLSKVAAPLSEKIMGPLGTVLLAALYLFRDFLPDRKIAAISAPVPSRKPDLAPSPAAPKFELQSVAREPKAEAQGLEEAIRAMIATDSLATEYSAQRFFITDATGNRRGVIGVNDDGSPLMALFTSEGNAGLVVSELAGGLTMGFYDSGGQLRARLSMADAAPRLALNDGEGRERVGLSVRSDGSPCFFVADDDQTVRLGFVEQVNGTSAIRRK